jgi:hypothetical protein
LLRNVQAKLLAGRGVAEGAEALARESVALADETDFLDLRWHTRMGLAEVLGTAGGGTHARAVLLEAREIAERKGNVVAAQRAASRLEELLQQR